MTRADEPLDVTAAGDGATFAVKVVPGAARTRIAGRWQRAVRIAIAAPPEAGRANEALVAYVAEVLGVRRASVSVVSGHAQPQKRIHVAGMSVAETAARLSGAISVVPPPSEEQRSSRRSNRKKKANDR